jgi:hypothetical protein
MMMINIHKFTQGDFKMLPSQFKRMQKEKQNKPLPLRKISNNFLFNAVENSNPHTLKTMFYLASILRDLDLKNKDDEELVEFFIDREKMEQYTMIDIVSIRKSLKTMQKTSISFVNEIEKLETNINLLPLYEVIYNKNQIRLKLFVKVAKMLIDVETNYSYLNTKQFMKLDSKHSIRMLGLLNKIDGYDRPTDKEYKLKKIKDNLDLIRDYPDYAKTEKLEEQNRELSREQLPKVIELTLEDLNSFFGTDYKRWNDFETRVLKPSMEELESKSPLFFWYDASFQSMGQGRPKFKNVRIYPKLQNGVQTRLSNFL